MIESGAFAISRTGASGFQTTYHSQGNARTELSDRMLARPTGFEAGSGRSTGEDHAASESEAAALFPLKLPLADGDKAQLTADQASTSLLVFKPSLHSQDPDQAAIKRASDAYAETVASFAEIQMEPADNHSLHAQG